MGVLATTSSRHLAALLLAGALLISGQARAAPFEVPDVGGDGGSPFHFECPNGQFVVGLAGNLGSLIDHVQMVCAKFNSQGRPVSAPALDGQRAGTSNGGAFRRVDCAAGSVIGNLVLSTGISENDRPFVIDNTVLLECFDRSDKRVDVKKFGDGADDGDKRRARGRSGCPLGFNAVGIHGQRGRLVDRLGLVCNNWPPRG